MHNTRHHLSIQGAFRRRGHLFGATLAALIALGFGREVRARTCIWKGSGNFSTSGNWNCSTGSGPPASADTAQFDATSTSACAINTAGGVTIANLSVNSGYTGTVTVSVALTVSGDLTIQAGTLTNTGAGSISVTGNVNVSDTVTNGGDPTLVGYWSFDDASHNQDSSGAGATLSWTGTSGTNFTSDTATAINFPDTTSVNLTNPNNAAPTKYAKSSSNLSSLSNLCPATLTLSAWYRAYSTDATASEVVSGANTYGLRITSSGLVVMKRIAISGTAQWIEYQVPFSGVLDGNWHQIVGVIVTGTGGGMTAYLDGVPAAGAYFIGGTTTKLDSTTTPTATYAADQPIDWTDAATTKNAPLAIGYNPSGATGYNFGATSVAGSTGNKCSTSNLCEIDDVRVYNRALTAAQVAALAGGNQPGGGAGILSLGGSLTVSGGVTVQSTGTLTLASGSTLSLGSGKILVMDGTLNASGGTITGAGAYAFDVGSSSTATPTLNINGLAVKKTDANGMSINADPSAVTTFTQFDNLAFSSGTSGTTTTLLNINASTLYLASNGCTFDGSTKYAVVLTANSGSSPRALFGNATCATNDSTTGLCATSEKKDDDSDNNGIPDSGTGAVVQFVRAAESDTDGTQVGFPTAAFNWNDFSYYSTYVTFHNASSGSDVIYVRDEAGKPLYSWIDPTATETITGTPHWISTTVASVTTHYLYVSVNGSSSDTGKVYRLIDTGTGTTSGTLTIDASWATSGAYSCTCTVTSDLSVDANNVYWAATIASAQKLMGIKQSNGAPISGSWPVTTPANVTTSSPTLSTVSGTTTLYLGVTADLLQLAVTGTTFVQDTKPGTITGRVSFGTSYLAATNGTSRVYAGDSAGNLTAISPTDFTASHFLWSYPAGSAITNNLYDGATDTVAFGTSGGKVVVLNGAGSGTSGSLLNTSYPYTLNTSDPITAAPLYVNGVLVVGTTLGKLYFLDRNTGLASPNGVSILRKYDFGPTQSVSTIGFDANVSRYMVSTSSVANDGRIYYFDAVSDMTPTFQ